MLLTEALLVLLKLPDTLVLRELVLQALAVLLTVEHLEADTVAVKEPVRLEEPLREGLSVELTVPDTVELATEAEGEALMRLVRLPFTEAEAEKLVRFTDALGEKDAAPERELLAVLEGLPDTTTDSVLLGLTVGLPEMVPLTDKRGLPDPEGLSDAEAEMFPVAEADTELVEEAEKLADSVGAEVPDTFMVPPEGRGESEGKPVMETLEV